MKQLIKTTMNPASIRPGRFFKNHGMLLSRLLMIMFSGSLAIAACKKQSSSDVKDPMNEIHRKIQPKRS